MKEKRKKDLKDFAKSELVGICDWLNKKKEGVGPWFLLCVIKLYHLPVYCFYDIMVCLPFTVQNNLS